MDWKTISGLLQVLVPTALAYAVAKGWVSQSQVADLTAAVITIGAAIWSAVTNRNAGGKS